METDGVRKLLMKLATKYRKSSGPKETGNVLLLEVSSKLYCSRWTQMERKKNIL
jgi:hypothetical protein